MFNLWSQILNLLEKTLSPGIYQVWVQPLEAEFGKDKLTLFAPNSFVASWVGDKLKDSVAEAAAQVLGHKPAIEICVRGQDVKHAAARPKPQAESLPTADARQQLGLPDIASSGLRCFSWQYSFTDFVVGQCNELAFAACQALSSCKMDWDQLVLTSSPGLGKTHLLQAIGQHMTRQGNKKHLRMAYLSAEEFSRQLVLAIKSRQTDQFKAKFREKLDVLLLEDIHFIQGKEHTQEELRETLNALKARGCKVILTSSFLPHELKNVDSHLSSRLCSGVLARIHKPDFATRQKILITKAKKYKENLPRNVAGVLAEHITGDVRQLESCLHNMILKARLLGQTISTGLAKDVLENYSLTAKTHVDLEHIIRHVCSFYNIAQEDLGSRSRRQEIVIARNTAFFLARKYTDMPLQQIGIQFNRRHSTVLKGINKVERELHLQTPLGRQLDTVIKKVHSL